MYSGGCVKPDAECRQGRRKGTQGNTPKEVRVPMRKKLINGGHYSWIYYYVPLFLRQRTRVVSVGNLFVIPMDDEVFLLTSIIIAIFSVF